MTVRISTLVLGMLLCVSGIVFYFFNFHYIDLQSGCNIAVHPGFLELNNRNVVQALKVLKYASPDDYLDVCMYVDDIHLAMSCGGWQGGCHYGDVGAIYVSTTHDEFIASTAMIIVHETCHDMQFREGKPMSEEECYARSDKTLQTLVRTE